MILGKATRQTMFGQSKGYLTACRGGQGEIERIHHPPISSKNKLKSFCEVAYANLGQKCFVTVRGYQWRFGWGWGYMHDAQQIKICSKSGNVQEKYLATTLCNIIYNVPGNFSYF